MNKKRRILQLRAADSFGEDNSERKKKKQQQCTAAMVSMELKLESKIKERLAKDEAAYGAFVEQWRLYKGGKMSKHDLCCEIISLFSDEIHDLVPDLRHFFKDSSPAVA
ncbi:unnamed protein product [Linum trigynum]|uniref:ZNF598/HEL2 PAH domain-containing protein n=1 Tax=Linum trigynum TaxID=586398 RepID=A0AAV2CEK6_9ROSI